MTSGLVLNLLGTVTNFNIDIDKNNLNTIRRASENEEGISDDCHRSDHEVDVANCRQAADIDIITNN